MGLGLNYDSTSGADFASICKYDAKAGRIFRVDRDQETRTNNQVDITRDFKAVFDMENIEVGWMDFPVGAAPVFALAPLGEKFPERPNDKAKQGVRVTMKLHAGCGGDVREMATSAKTAMRGIDELHTAYESGEKQNPGKLPVVVLKDTIPVVSEGRGQKSTNYAPVFEIVGWVNRPENLIFKPKNAAAPAPAARPAPPATGSTQVQAPKPATVDAGSDDFG